MEKTPGYFHEAPVSQVVVVYGCGGGRCGRCGGGLWKAFSIYFKLDLLRLW